MKSSKNRKTPIKRIEEIEQLVLAQVDLRPFVEVEEIFRNLPGYMYRDIWTVLLDLQQQGKVMLKQFDGESTGLVINARLNESQAGSSESSMERIFWKDRGVELTRS